jgi:hypothetical protein
MEKRLQGSNVVVVERITTSMESIELCKLGRSVGRGAVRPVGAVLSTCATTSIQAAWNSVCLRRGRGASRATADKQEAKQRERADGQLHDALRW